MEIFCYTYCNVKDAMFESNTSFIRLSAKLQISSFSSVLVCILIRTSWRRDKYKTLMCMPISRKCARVEGSHLSLTNLFNILGDNGGVSLSCWVWYSITNRRPHSDLRELCRHCKHKFWNFNKISNACCSFRLRIYITHQVENTELKIGNLYYSIHSFTHSISNKSKKMLKRREVCDTYLNHVCRHQRNVENPTKRWRSFYFYSWWKPQCWLKTPLSFHWVLYATLISTAVSQVGITFFPPF